MRTFLASAGVTDCYTIKGRSRDVYKTPCHSIPMSIPTNPSIQLCEFGYFASRKYPDYTTKKNPVLSVVKLG